MTETYDPSALWSLNGATPEPLPQHKRINGFTYTNLTQRDRGELASIGFIEAGPKPVPLRGYKVVWEDNIWKQQQVPGTPSDINVHRLMLIRTGVLVNVTGVPNPIRIAGEIDDQVNLLGLYNAAVARLQLASQGDVAQAAHITIFRDEDNVDHQLTPSQIVELWSKGAAWVSLVYQASWNLKDIEREHGLEIMHDYFDPRYWPPSSI